MMPSSSVENMTHDLVHFVENAGVLLREKFVRETPGVCIVQRLRTAYNSRGVMLHWRIFATSCYEIIQHAAFILGRNAGRMTSSAEVDMDFLLTLLAQTTHPPYKHPGICF